MELSIVTTLYYSSPYIKEFHQRATKVAKKLFRSYEIIFVNDGSPDDSLEVIRAIAEQDPAVIVINLSRNFGHHKAIMTGLSHARGDLVFLIDVDLEFAPELLFEFYQRMQNTKADVIFGIRKKRTDNFISNLGGFLFYPIFNFFSEVKIPKNLTTVRLMSNRYVKNLIKHKEKQFIIAGLWELTGFRQLGVEIKKKYKGSTKYSIVHNLSIIINAITSFSAKPLVYIFNIGFFILAVSIVFILYLIVKKLFFGIPISGWTSLIVTLWFFGGLLIFFLGIIGIYISKIFIETKKRPYTIISDIFTKNEEDHTKDNSARIRKKVGLYYSNKIIMFGTSSAGVDWNSKEAQELRFEQFLPLFTKNRTFSLIAYGCGYGELYLYLKSRGFSFSFVGFDISKEMIKRAREYLPTDPSVTLVDNRKKLSQADFVVASGIFNVKSDVSQEQWKRYIISTLEDINSLANEGFSFNMLTSYSDYDFMQESLYYGDPCFFFDYCKRNFSKEVSLIHDYGLYDFSIIVRKNER